MSTRQDSDAPSTAAPQRGKRRIVRQAMTVVGACGIALLLAIVLAAAALGYAGDVQHAELGLRAARPWLIVGQLVALALLWHRWASFVSVLGRWWRMPNETQAAFILARPRIFGLLAVCETLIVLRALAT